MKLAKKLLALNLALLLIFSAFSTTALAAAIPLYEGQRLHYATVNPDGYRFTPSKSGYYSINSTYSTASIANLRPYVYTSATSIASSYKVPALEAEFGGFHSIVKLNAGTPYTVRIHDRTWNSANFLSANYIPLEKLTTSASFTAYNGAGDMPHIFEYKPTKAGWYTFTSAAKGTLQVFDSTGKSYGSGSPAGSGTSIYLPSAKTYLVCYAPYASSGSLKVTSASIPKLTTTTSATPNSEGYVSFTPTTSGSYTITVKAPKGSNGIVVYDSNKNEVMDDRGKPSETTWTTKVSLTANKTYYIWVWCDSTSTVSAKLSGNGAKHTVTFNPNGGKLLSSESRTKTVTNGLDYGYLPYATKDGYSLKGWYTSISGGTQIKESTTVNLSANQTLYARWVPEYTITLNANGGSVSSSANLQVKTFKAASGSAYGELPPPRRTGYTFDGWYTAKTGGTKITPTSKVTGNKTLYAHWIKGTAVKYTVTFNVNGGKLPTGAAKTKTVTKGSTYGTLPTPTRTGYKFAGWYTSQNAGTKVLSSTKVTLTKNQTLYAHWTKTADESNTTYTVNFNANNGVVFQRYKAVIGGSKYRELPTPTRAGYHFLGWYTKATGGTKVTEKTLVTQTKDHTLYAHWSKTAVTKKTDVAGSWTITIPARYRLPLYASNITPTQASVSPAQTRAYTVKCTRKATLSNGTVRYYGLVNGQYRWFQFTCEMDVD